jgi:hypothetical protein
MTRHIAWNDLRDCIDMLKRCQARAAGGDLRLSDVELAKIAEARAALDVACQEFERVCDWE